MAVAAIFSEQAYMTIFRRMARHALQCHLQPGGPGLIAKPLSNQVSPRRGFGLRIGYPILAPANPREGRVVHRDRTHTHAPVLDMALSTAADVRMKGSGLPLEEDVIVRMADDAVGRLNAVNRGVTGTAFLFKERMGVREWPWTDKALQLSGVGRHVNAHDSENDGRESQTEHDHNEDPLFHGWNHLSP